MDLATIRRNLTDQLEELEALEAVYSLPGEIRMEDPKIVQQIRSFVEGELDEFPPDLDFTVNLTVEEEKFEIRVGLPRDYPNVEPEIYVRNRRQSRAQHARLNKDLGVFIKGCERGEPCLFAGIHWLQDNAKSYVENDETKVANEAKDVRKEEENLVRYWIYSHHIYSSTKRREILNLAQQLKLTGFCMPGKPGIICVEGCGSDCDEWWQTIKAMNWKRIFCKVTEECKGDREGFLKFTNFREAIFQNNSIKCAHMDLGELHKFLEQHNCDYIFKDLFGVDSKTNL